MWSCSWNLDDPNIIYAGLNTGRIQVFDRRQVQIGETTLSSSIETLSLSSGLLIGSNDKSGFYEYLSNCEYHFYELPIDSKSFFLILMSKTNFCE